jgi:hypothetical protein
MVEVEVRMSHEVHNDGDAIEAVGLHGVGGTQDFEEIMCPEVVADIPKSCHP